MTKTAAKKSNRNNGISRYIPKYADGDLVGNYNGDSFGQAYNAVNPYTYGMGPEKVYNFSSGANLVANTPPDWASKYYENLSPEAQKYLTKKAGFDIGNTFKYYGYDAGMDAINQIVDYKGGQHVTDLSQVNSSLAPLIAKRNKRGLGGILGAVAPIALSFLAPGLGTALGTALSIGSVAGTGLAGAGLGALGSAISGGNIGKGALLGGLGGVGSALTTGAGLSSVLGKGTASDILNTVGNNATKLGKVGAAAASGGSSLLSNAGNIAQLAKLGGGVLGSSQPQQQQQGYSQDQIGALIQQLQAQQGGRGGLFGSAAGRGYNKGGNVRGYNYGGLTQGYAGGNRVVNGPGDGMSDGVSATINGRQPAMLSDGEHVVPALQVAMLGRGSTKAGSEKIANLVLKEIESTYGKGVDPKRMQKKAMGK